MHYNMQMDHAPENLANISTKGSLIRVLAGVILFIAAVLLFFVLYSGIYPRWVRITLWLPFFFSVLKMMQAKSQISIIKSYKGIKDTDTETSVPVSGTYTHKAMIRRSNILLMYSAILAALLTAGMFWL